jgi:hypothetical protein
MLSAALDFLQNEHKISSFDSSGAAAFFAVLLPAEAAEGVGELIWQFDSF